VGRLNFDVGMLLRRRESGGMGQTNGAVHAALSFEDIAATRVHQHLVPGTGAIDFAATLSMIAATGYEAGSPSSCIRMSPTRTKRPGRRGSI